MKKILTILTMGTLFSTPTMAQSSFEGAFGQIGAGYESVNPTLGSASVQTGGGNYPATTSIQSANDFVAQASLGYYLSVTPKFLIGVGADWAFVDGSVAYYSVNTPLGSGPGDYKKTNAYDFYISPATPIGEDGLLYGKLGVATFDKTKTETGKTIGFHGYNLGLGYKQFITGGFYGFAEANYYIYQNSTVQNCYATSSTFPAYCLTSTTGLSNYNLMLGVGYKF